MAMIMIGHSQLRQVGGRGGAVPVGLSPGGGGLACLLIAAPCDAQYAHDSGYNDHRIAFVRMTWGRRPGNLQVTALRYGVRTAAPSKRPAFRSRRAWSAASSG